MKRRVGVGERRSLNVQAYVDAQKVASLASFMTGRGLLSAPQYGQIIQEAFDFYLLVMRERHQGEFEEFSTIGEALQWLEQNGFSMAQFKERGGYNGTIPFPCYLHFLNEAHSYYLSLSPRSQTARSFDRQIDHRRRNLQLPSRPLLLTAYALEPF